LPPAKVWTQSTQNAAGKRTVLQNNPEFVLPRFPLLWLVPDRCSDEMPPQIASLTAACRKAHEPQILRIFYYGLLGIADGGMHDS
jgi:hypothetical protein